MIKTLNDSLKNKLLTNSDPDSQEDLGIDTILRLRFEIADELIRKFDFLRFRPFFTKRPIRGLGEKGQPTNFCLKCMIVHSYRPSDSIIEMGFFHRLVSLVDDFPAKDGKAAYFRCQYCETMWEEND